MADRVVVHEEPRLAVIAARAGSKRVPRKNVRLLGGQPMLAYTIASALQSRVFDAVIVSTKHKVNEGKTLIPAQQIVAGLDGAELDTPDAEPVR